MDARSFSDMRTINKLNMTGLKVGDKFLFGAKMLSQKEEKTVGDPITYYEVIAINKHGNVEYKVVFDKLEEF